MYENRRTFIRYNFEEKIEAISFSKYVLKIRIKSSINELVVFLQMNIGNFIIIPLAFVKINVYFKSYLPLFCAVAKKIMLNKYIW